MLIEMSNGEKPWRSSVSAVAAYAMRGHARFVNTPLAALMVFGFARPKKHYTTKGLRLDAPAWHTGTPDASKLARSVEDALNAIVWDDDSRVAQLFVLKSYVELDESPGVAVKVAEADGLATESAVDFYRRVAERRMECMDTEETR